jgi:hypothetical protein
MVNFQPILLGPDKLPRRKRLPISSTGGRPHDWNEQRCFLGFTA